MLPVLNMLQGLPDTDADASDVEQPQLYQKSFWEDAIGGATAGSPAGPWGAVAGAALGIFNGFFGSGMDRAGGAEIRKQLEANGEDPQMINDIIAWAKVNKPDWYDGTASIYEGDGRLLHELENAWSAARNAAAAAKQRESTVTKYLTTGLVIAGAVGAVLLIAVMIRRLRNQ